MILEKEFVYENELQKGVQYHVYDDEKSIEMSHAGVLTRDTAYAGGFIKSMLLAGVGTLPQYRRMRCVRYILNDLWADAENQGWKVCLMHPFSFDYYRKFGAERVADTIQCDMPIYALSFVPRYPDLVPLTKERESDLIELFAAFTKNRNLSFKRNSITQFSGENRMTYLYYGASGRAEGYVTIEPRNHYDGINRMISDDLVVWELGFLNRDAILKLLGFLRMYEGELETVHFHDIGLTPELDYVFKHYMHTRYDIHPDVAVRIFDTEAMLKANVYPDEHGVFTLRVEDSIPKVAGTYKVEYQNGKCEVNKLTDTDSCDLLVGPQALARILYGVDSLTPELVSYFEGARCYTDCKDLFAAFPKRINGLYEHF